MKDRALKMYSRAFAIIRIWLDVLKWGCSDISVCRCVRYLLPIAAVTAFMLPSAAAQTAAPQGNVQPPALRAIIEAFQEGDSGTLTKYSARRLDVTLFGISELFSRSQAGYVLHDFFRQYRPERLEITEASGAEGNWFAAGRYWYGRGDAPLAVYLRLRSGEGGWELREVRIGRTVDR